MLRHALDPPPPVLSGHAQDGRSLERPHAAFLALPELDSRSGEPGSIAGVAVVLPRELDIAERQAALLGAARWERNGLRLVLGKLGVIPLARCEASAGSSLDSATWTRPARRWTSVTPVALHHNPGDLTARDPAKAARAARRAEEIVATGCAHVGLPLPARVRIMRRSRFPGIPSAPEFMPFPRKPAAGAERLKRVCVHVEIGFAEPVQGPVLLGAGRYFGVGLCAPLARPLSQGGRSGLGE
jgi:CRISPR-associated protein Csb2